MGAYRFVEKTPSGTLTITDAEVAAHIVLFGNSEGFTVAFDDATNFTERRMYRFTNHGETAVMLSNFDASLRALLLPHSIVQVTLADLTTEAGDWDFISHVAGACDSLT